jgi:hypothetical protein
MVERVALAIRKAMLANQSVEVAEAVVLTPNERKALFPLARAAIEAMRPRAFGDLPIEVAVAGEEALQGCKFPSLGAVHECVAAVIDAALAEGR